METSLSVCMTGMFLCIVFYALAKVLLYVYLVEVVHVVWTPHNTPRLQSPIYLVGIVTILLYGAVVVTLIIGRIYYLNQADGYCYIGLKFYASLTLLSYDTYITLFLTGLFLWPLLKSKFVNPRTYDVARRTLVSAMVALAISIVNTAVLAAWHGTEREWMFLACCTTDIIFNSLALFWVTRDSPEDRLTSNKNAPREQVMMKALKDGAEDDDMESPSPRRRGFHGGGV
ncbi:hypothetical protein D9758_006362 [Tetrapyrgos nigripes]|uniref:Uncharacterized protein n=1 Tax=Tetrapyrgos nigripes TaxID=182062 RepID=A0A8H5D8L8_9AGAR|nr:hypothetical protein D9758_006362 [Tetrapyrgos nigripes]